MGNTVQGYAARQLFQELARLKSLVGLWPLNEASGTIKDRGPNRLDGSALGNPTFSKAIGQFYGLDLDGTADAVNLTDVAALDFERTDLFSGIAVIAPNISAEGAILAKYDATSTPDRGWSFALNSGRQVHLRLANGSANLLDVRGGTALVNGTTYLVGFTYAGASAPADIILYVNGVAETPTTVSNTLSATISAAGYKAKIGAHDNLTADEFNGDVGMVALWDGRVLTAEEMRRFAFLAGLL